MSSSAEMSVEHLLRALAPQVLGLVARKYNDFAGAEDAVQEALIAAAAQWEVQGTPNNPQGWLYHVAMRRLTDQIRSEVARRRREGEMASQVWADWAFVPSADAHVDVEHDDSLALLFMCCHPSLTPPTAIALTLRAVGGLTTAEIARAFLVPEATMAQRISRAKATIKSSGIKFAMPTDAERVERMSSVLHVLYLIFNEGYASSAGDALARTDLSTEAIRLTRLLLSLVTADPEVEGLLALMLLTDARRSARVGKSGELIPLDEQDRALWNRAQIAEGVSVIEHAFARGNVGPYQLQAAIAAIHDDAADVNSTDWPQILALYLELERVSPSPVITLNRVVAFAMVEGPNAGLEALRELDADARIAGHYRLNAVRAHLNEKARNVEEARRLYLAASEATASAPERDYLRLKAARLH